MKSPQLSEEDQARVESYLSRPHHQIERKPFRPWLLLAWLVAILTIMSLLSYGIAWWHGVV
ncbi:DUF3094 domain-containing protein [Candidatus Endobugula sertula]|uniref:DUF3094 domain-containing protein n=1 Tax=Candidatus Endobugula sertula TaxID=62101 RepID=A0A1D2QRQ5_9GAMM|nr:DUF3094 domain-containing protein [Candidatus Endobugula sertula]